MTKREYYDLLIKSAFDGTFPSLDKDGICLYRGPDNKKCAVGLLIPDHCYNSCMEHKYARWVHDNFSFQFIPEGLTIENLCRIQSIHDNLAKDWDAGTFVSELNAMECFGEFND